MGIARRETLKRIGAGAAALVGAKPKAHASSRPRKEAQDDAVGMLYDATRCIGCKACVAACSRVNNLEPERTSADGLYQDPQDLSGDTMNIIKLHRDGEQSCFMKMQCMHCIDPACVSVCMIGALHKTDFGIVAYDKDRCIGCRYCQIACPFDVPKFQWDKAAPLIVKCELCHHRLKEGKLPGCCEACPREAIIFGKRSSLLEEARRRLAEHPDRYLQHIYGETEGGGTQVLYLSAAGVPFTKLGLPDLDDQALPHLSETIQHGVYRGFIAPAVLYAALGTAVFRNRRRVEKGESSGTSTSNDEGGNAA